MSEASRSADAHYYRELLKPVFAGRRFAIIGGVVVQLAQLGRELLRLGAERPLLIGSARGIGPVPDPEELPWCSLDLGGEGIMGTMWRYEAALSDPPEAVRRALDAWDPECRAQATGYILMSDVPSLAGRGRYARRPAAWTWLEDKTRVHALLDLAGVRRGPLAIARAEALCLRAAHARIDRGAGTVWAGDTRPGIHGGGSFVRRVFGERTLADACALFTGACDRVRVMPFVEGVPCSIHGLVFPEGVAVFRPVELITLRRCVDGQFVYAGTATFWDPEPEARERMRVLARRVGRCLRDRVGFGGAFTLDGVLAGTEFVPTELNARMGAGFQHLMDALPELPLGPLALAAQHGERLDYRPGALEALVLEAADARRSGSGRLLLRGTLGPERTLALLREGSGFRTAGEDEKPDADLLVGSAADSGVVFYRPRRRGVVPGQRLASDVVRAFALADACWDTGIGPLEPARVVA